MYCSDCFFFRNDGICKNPKVPKRDVGYFQKAGSCFAEMKEQMTAEIVQESPKIEQKPMDKEQKTATKVCADCGRELPLESFQKNVKGERISVCKECMSKRRMAGKTKLPKGTPEQHLLEAIFGKDYKENAEGAKAPMYLDKIPSPALVEELKRRGYHGRITKTIEVEF